MAIVASAIITTFGGKDLADRIIDRYELSGEGADAVRHVFSPTGGASAGVSVVGGLLLLIAVLSFTRALQRLFEQTWELEPLSLRNTLNGLRWVAGFVAYSAAVAAIHALLGRRIELTAGLAVIPLSLVF